MDPKKAIKEKSVTCLECGKSFKILTKKHLATHGLAPEEYKEKWGYKKNTPLVCKSLQRERRKKMKEMRLWEKRKK
jgi:predicted transcriptional regulator